MKKYDNTEVDQNLHMNDDGFCWLIVTDKAKDIYNNGLFDLYEVRDDDTESMIENYDELLKCLENGSMIGIEVGHSNVKNYSNGFESWQETHFEVVSAITRSENAANSEVSKIASTEGTGGLYELANTLTDEFEKKHQGRLWDGDFFDEIESFLSERLN